MKENIVQRKVLLITAVLAAGTLGAAIWFSWPGGVPQETLDEKVKIADGAGIRASENFYDFGAISMAEGRVSYRYRIKNESEKPTVIAKIYTSCMCTEAMFENGLVTKGPFGMPGHGESVPAANVTMEPGSEAEIIATFDPAAHGPAGVGKIEREIYIESAESEPLILKFLANVTP